MAGQFQTPRRACFEHVRGLAQDAGSGLHAMSSHATGDTRIAKIRFGEAAAAGSCRVAGNAGSGRAPLWINRTLWPFWALLRHRWCRWAILAPTALQGVAARDPERRASAPRGLPHGACTGRYRIASTRGVHGCLHFVGAPLPLRASERVPQAAETSHVS